jgi:hypothetical protein
VRFLKVILITKKPTSRNGATEKVGGFCVISIALFDELAAEHFEGVVLDDAVND